MFYLENTANQKQEGNCLLEGTTSNLPIVPCINVSGHFNFYFMVKEWTMSSVRPSNLGCTRVVGRAQR